MSYRESGHGVSDVVKALRDIRPHYHAVPWRQKAHRGVRKSLLLRLERQHTGETRREQDRRRQAAKRAGMDV